MNTRMTDLTSITVLLGCRRKGHILEILTNKGAISTLFFLIPRTITELS